MYKTKIINPILNINKIKSGGKKKMAKRRRRKPTVTKIIRRSPRKMNYTKQVLYVFAGLVAAGLLNKMIKLPQKYLVGLGGSLLILTLGKKMLGSNAVPIAVGMGAAGLFAYAAQHPQLKGLLSDYGIDVNGVLDLANVDPSTLRALTSGGGGKVMNDYFINPHKAGMHPGNLTFADMQ